MTKLVTRYTPLVYQWLGLLYLAVAVYGNIRTADWWQVALGLAYAALWGWVTQPPREPTEARWVHSKTGRTYALVGYARLRRYDPRSHDRLRVVVYRSCDDGELWVRHANDFLERFEELGDGAYYPGVGAP
jgi:hypothetical protein